MNRPITYAYSSLRFFNQGGHHISRRCPEDVLLLVYDGVLRFHEDGMPYEIRPGQYHIQRKGSLQIGKQASDAPKYLYVHFLAEWADSGAVLPRSGTFEYAKFKTTIEDMDTLAHANAPYIIQSGKFYELLSMLYQKIPTDTLADHIADFIAKECPKDISIERLCKEFHFSKNHIINTFKKAFGMTPIAYMNHLRLKQAEYRMIVTSDSLEQISLQCGFQTYSHFYKLFLRKNGQSPEQWRKDKRI